MSNNEVLETNQSKWMPPEPKARPSIRRNSMDEVANDDSFMTEDSDEFDPECTDELDSLENTRNSPGPAFPYDSSQANLTKVKTTLLWKIKPYLILFSCLAVVNALYTSKGNVKNTSWRTIDEIKTKFTHQNLELWNSVYSSITEAVEHPGKPGIVILYGSDAHTINCLAHSLGIASVSMMQSHDYLTLKPSDLKHDVGEVIYELKEPIKKAKVVVVEDILSVNAEALKAFHNFCDRENPLVGEAIYIMTMIMSDPDETHNDLEVVEREFSRKFSTSIKKDIFDPLITRITDGAVVHVSSDSVTDCPSNQ